MSRDTWNLQTKRKQAPPQDAWPYSYRLVKKCFVKICETSKCHNFLIFQPIFIRFSLFCSHFTLSSEIKLNLAVPEFPFNAYVHCALCIYTGIWLPQLMLYQYLIALYRCLVALSIFIHIIGGHVLCAWVLIKSEYNSSFKHTTQRLLKSNKYGRNASL